MSGKSVVFYAIEEDFFTVAFKLLERLYSVNERVLFLCDSEEEVLFFNSKIWTCSRLSFIPHGDKSSMTLDEANYCHTWISTDIVFYNNPVCLLHNGLDLSKKNDIKKFQKIIDIFNIKELDSAKRRLNFYNDESFSDHKLWIQSGGTWKAGNI